MTAKYDEHYEANKENEIKISKGIKTDLTECVTKVVGEVAIKLCFALTVAFCIGCWEYTELNFWLFYFFVYSLNYNKYKYSYCLTNISYSF